MKTTCFTCILFLLFNFAKSQQPAAKFQCDCKKIGLEQSWADSNKLSCYLLPVERNFEKPRNKSYLLAVAVAPALNKTSKEPLLYLHGGPGIATLSNLPRYLKSKTFTPIRADRDMIFFDYRGTGYSEPTMCEPLGDSVEQISKAGLKLEERINKTTAAYATCKQGLLEKDVLLSDFSTLQSANDAENIRKALGIGSWNIYSVSHGTTVALNMMRSFPKNIRSVILDSPFPPNAPWADFVNPFDLSFTALEKAISSDQQFATLFPSIRNDLTRLTERLAASAFIISPMPGDSARPGYFDDADMLWSVWSAMLSPWSIPQLPMALKEMAAGNDSVLLYWARMYKNPDAFGKFALAQSKAVLYYESKPRTLEETEEYIIKKYPTLRSFIVPGLEHAIYNAFRPESPDARYFNPVTSDIPTLIYAGEFDPVCLPLFAELTARSLTRSTLVIVPAASHAAIGADDCTRKIGKDFIDNPFIKPVSTCIAERKKIQFITKDILHVLK